MYLSSEQVILIFNSYLSSYALPRAINPLPFFNCPFGGKVLTKRLYKILRSKHLQHLVVGRSINFLEVLEHIRKFIKTKGPFKVEGLNHWFSEKDVDILHDIYLKKILSNS